ncbi:MAG: hypothetical protein HQL22_01315 [Candidatus Omnitrophica bacterium]|nr:hypothetical protein [Candidatus Omnitrophota bacterium]
MKNNKRNTMILAAVCLAGLSLAGATSSYAWERDHHGDRHYYHYHDRPSFGMRLSFIGDDVITVRSGRTSYYYYDGLYYNRAGSDYVLIPPPIGVVVTSIPPDFHPVVINGVTYFTDNGTYYVYTRYGYQVVPPPVTLVQQPVIVVQQPVVQAAAPAQPAVVMASQPPAAPVQDPVIVPEQVSVKAASPSPVQPVAMAISAEQSFTVNIPDNKGGYVAVVIKKTDKGFTGPQGELYETFPKVAQLQVMYVK